MFNSDFERIARELLSKRFVSNCNLMEFFAFARNFLPESSHSKIPHVAGTNGKGVSLRPSRGTLPHS